MSRTRVWLAVLVAVPCALGLGGCRGTDRAAQPAATVRSVPAAGDPLAGIESSVDAVERDVDADSRADSRTGTGADATPGR